MHRLRGSSYENRFTASDRLDVQEAHRRLYPAGMNGYTVTKHGHSRFWAVRDPAGDLVCVCVYKRGAVEVARRLALPVESTSAFVLHDAPVSAVNPPENSRKPV